MRLDRRLSLAALVLCACAGTVAVAVASRVDARSSRDASRAYVAGIAAHADDVGITRPGIGARAVVTAAAPSRAKPATAGARQITASPASRHCRPALVARHLGAALRYRIFRVLRI